MSIFCPTTLLIITLLLLGIMSLIPLTLHQALTIITLLLLMIVLILILSLTIPLPLMLNLHPLTQIHNLILVLPLESVINPPIYKIMFVPHFMMLITNHP